MKTIESIINIYPSFAGLLMCELDDQGAVPLRVKLNEIINEINDLKERIK